MLKYLWAGMGLAMAALFLVGAALLQSAHLLFGGIVLAIVGGVSWVIAKGSSSASTSTKKPSP